MNFDGAVIKEQGVTFAVVVVQADAASPANRAKTIMSFSRVFPGMPVVLMVQDARGVPTYTGRPDLVQFLARISMARVPWRRFQLT